MLLMLMAKAKRQKNANISESKRKSENEGQPDHRCENVPIGKGGYISLFTGHAWPEKLFVATMLQGGPVSN